MPADATHPPPPAQAKPVQPELTLADHARLVRALQARLQADAVVQTPISSILLAGESAYKLKKPVHFPFIDCRTLAQRRHFCEEELRLNRRTAAPLYLGLCAVSGTVEAPVLDGAGPPLDWAVHMRRFDAGAELRTLAERGALRAADIDALAAHLAAFHRALPALPEAAWPRKPIADWARETLDELEALPARGVPPEPAALARLREGLGAQFAALAPLMHARARSGHLREGHGDLHLGNLLRWGERVMAFDALEFEPALRCIDTVCDAAFAFMDLLAHGLDGWAWRFINAWAEATDEWAGLPLLRPCAAYRALVRAKVAALGGDAAAFARYFTLAQRLAARPESPQLLVMTGVSGSGKSRVAAGLAERLGALRLRSDVERKRLFGLEPTARATPGSELAATLYASDATTRTYARLHALAETLLRAGHTVVLDAAFLRQSERAAARALAQSCGAGFAVVACSAPEAVLRERLAAREREGADPSDATAAVLERQLRVAEPMPADWAAWTVEVDNSGDRAALDAALSQAATRLAARHGENAQAAQNFKENPPTPA